MGGEKEIKERGKEEELTVYLTCNYPVINTFNVIISRANS